MKEKETIEAGARARGVSVARLRAEAEEFERMRDGKRPSTTSGAIALRERTITEAAARSAAFNEAAAKATPTESVRLRKAAAEAAARIAAAGPSPAGTTKLREPARAARAIGNLRPPAIGSGPSTAGNLAAAGVALGLTPAAAKTFARGRGMSEAVTDGSGFKAGDYGYTPDLEDPSTWKLLLVLKPGDGASGSYDPNLVKQAATAITVPNWGAPQVDIPAADLAAVRQTLAGAWVQSGLAVADMPPALTQESLARAFRDELGMSRASAAVAAKGRL